MHAKAHERVTSGVDAKILHLNKDLALLELRYRAGDDVQNISGAAGVFGHELLPYLWDRRWRVRLQRSRELRSKHRAG